MMVKIKKRRGWSKDVPPPHRDKKIAVEPIRKESDILKIKNMLREHRRKRDYVLFVLGINTGLRGGDLLSLKWGDVLDDEGEIVSHLDVRERKTKKHRSIMLGSRPKKALTMWLKKHEDDLDKDAYLFPSQKGGRMTIQRLHQLINQWCERAKIKGNYGTHTLRKTYGFHHYNRGVDLAILMKIFGHSSQQVTLRYIGIRDKDIDEANLNLNL